MLETILAIIRTLNDVEVKGKKNLDGLLGSIQYLEAIAAELQKKPEAEVVDIRDTEPDTELNPQEEVTDG